MTNEEKVLTLHLPKELWDELSEIKAEDGICMNAFIRKAVRERLDSWTRPSERPYGGDGL
jgi:hypothetical protein